MQQNGSNGPDDYISREEREHLLSELHRFLVWVGEQLPEEVDVNGEKVKLHEMIWHCIHQDQLSEQEKERYMELVRLLEAKERRDEELLKTEELTHEEAKELYHEAAALIRAIMDLRECEEGKVRLKEAGEEQKKKIDDARRWLSFLKSIGKK
ncbi:MAG TPA: DUF5788 family protein [Candidatus Methanoperedens sp.]|nr:DUF5788 family protein [Candidatus Methanoperedens sp.]HLB71721.1 DUF5788 family protein [Candidatus Methanoperedens sp.]